MTLMCHQWQVKVTCDKVYRPVVLHHIGYCIIKVDRDFNADGAGACGCMIVSQQDIDGNYLVMVPDVAIEATVTARDIQQAFLMREHDGKPN